jgi:hypothetical protein
MDSALRNYVRARANDRCEYCRLPQQFHFVPLQIEHITARQHRGDDSAENLALACLRCNLHKGTNLVSIEPLTGAVTPLFNPRTQNWAEHFELRGGEIIGMTAIGRTTAILLAMNTPDRIELRIDLLAAGLWP